ncbi:hypothetical protein GCM10009853_070380 [Glycomyces scopariae]
MTFHAALDAHVGIQKGTAALKRPNAICVDYGALWRTPSPSATPPEYYAHPVGLETGIDV